MNLSDPSLLITQAYVNAEWTGADDGSTFEVKNPATGEKLADVSDLSRVETKRAITAAHEAFQSWREKTARERSKALIAWRKQILANLDDLALLITSEQGKPLAEAKGEVLYGASFLEWFAEEGKRVYGDIIPSHAGDKRLMVLKQPIGVVGAITPWNFPLAMITRKLGPALAVGCTAVLKPGEDTPLTALALAELAHRAGIPKGVINVIPCQKSKAPEVGLELTRNSLVRKISFTGSTPVGKKLMEQCASNVTKISLELGGNAPFIVFDDADLDAAVDGAMISKYRNAGQTCICANRIFVQDGVYEAFSEKLAAKVQKLKVGVGIEEGTTQGPLINQAALDKVDGLVKDATSKGAKVLCGGKPADLGGTFYEPTILCDVSSDMRVCNEEIFGPVAPLYRFTTEKEAIQKANETPFGLAAYFYARDMARIWRVSEGLEYGMVGVNEGTVSTEVAPFGGIKESGIGREGSKYGVDDFVEMKFVCMGGVTPHE